MTIELETVCRKCGTTFTPEHRDFVTGAWRTCPLCRKPASKSAYSRGGSAP